MIYGMVIAPVPPPAIKDGFARDASPDRSGLTRERACYFEGKVTFRALLSGEANGSHFMCRMRRPLAVRLKPDTTTALSTRSEDCRL